MVLFGYALGSDDEVTRGRSPLPRASAAAATTAPKPTHTRVRVRTPVKPRTSVPEPAAYFLSCADAREAGAAPLLRGNAGYREALDRDGDGVACE